MTKKDYILIAEAIRCAYNRGMHRPASALYEDIVDTLASELEYDNPAFKPGVFKEACGYK
jgi:hypothetical protein